MSTRNDCIIPLWNETDHAERVPWSWVATGFGQIFWWCYRQQWIAPTTTASFIFAWLCSVWTRKQSLFPHHEWNLIWKKWDNRQIIGGWVTRQSSPDQEKVMGNEHAIYLDMNEAVRPREITWKQPKSKTHLSACSISFSWPGYVNMLFTESSNAIY